MAPRWWVKTMMCDTEASAFPFAEKIAKISRILDSNTGENPTKPKFFQKQPLVSFAKA